MKVNNININVINNIILITKLISTSIIIIIIKIKIN